MISIVYFMMVVTQCLFEENNNHLWIRKNKKIYYLILKEIGCLYYLPKVTFV